MRTGTLKYQYPVQLNKYHYLYNVSLNFYKIRTHEFDVHGSVHLCNEYVRLKVQLDAHGFHNHFIVS
jgi:hypothetical protein